jgi:hypothetical protein
MHILSRFWVVGLALILALALTGCKKHKDTAPEPTEPQGNPLKPDPAGGAPAASDVQRGAQLRVIENLMRNIGQYYILYSNENNRPPKTLEEFKAYLRSDPNARNEAQALDKGWLVLRLDPPPNANQVLAYEKEPYQKWNNRVVLLGGGAVQLMTDAEFQAALKAR